jgi:hypothetical protein
VPPFRRVQRYGAVLIEHETGTVCTAGGRDRVVTQQAASGTAGIWWWRADVTGQWALRLDAPLSACSGTA